MTASTRDVRETVRFGGKTLAELTACRQEEEVSIDDGWGTRSRSRRTDQRGSSTAVK